MPLSFELFATTATAPEALWDVVGDPARLPEWTDADEVHTPQRSLAEGDDLRVVVGGCPMTWTILTTGRRILEGQADTPRGQLGLGVHVSDDPLGSRLVLAGTLEPAGSKLAARLLTLPRLRSALDRWSAAAIALAREGQ